MNIRFDTEQVLNEEGQLADFKQNKNYTKGMRGRNPYPADDAIDDPRKGN